MRISDWSSDVCSSDLSLPCHPPSCQCLGDQPPRVVAPEQRDEAAHARPGARSEQRLIERPEPELGRASCRERVCQYVSISVVAASLKQKKIRFIHQPFNINITVYIPQHIQQHS